MLKGFVVKQEDEELPFAPAVHEPRLSRKALMAVLEDRCNIVVVGQKRPYTYIQVTSYYDNIEYTGEGFSKVMYPDRWNNDDGIDIARRRALYDIVHQIRKHEELLDCSI